MIQKECSQFFFQRDLGLLAESNQSKLKQANPGFKLHHQLVFLSFSCQAGQLTELNKKGQLRPKFVNAQWAAACLIFVAAAAFYSLKYLSYHSFVKCHVSNTYFFNFL